MAMLNVDEVDKYRFSYEIDEHWNYRRAFLLAHADHIPEQRLLCLAQVYVNMKIMHVGYRADLMEEVNSLALQIPKET